MFKDYVYSHRLWPMSCKLLGPNSQWYVCRGVGKYNHELLGKFTLRNGWVVWDLFVGSLLVWFEHIIVFLGGPSLNDLQPILKFYDCRLIVNTIRAKVGIFVWGPRWKSHIDLQFMKIKSTTYIHTYMSFYISLKIYLLNPK